MPSARYEARQERRRRANYSRFKSLIDTPSDLGAVAASAASAALTMPGPARLAMSLDAVLAEGDVTVDIGGRRSFSHPALAVDERYKGWWSEQGQDIIINRGALAPAGTFTLYLVHDYGKMTPIATATFSV